jgi:hypothetical protein
MSFKSSLTEANPRQDTDVIPRQRNESIVPRQRTEVKEALSKLARTPPVDAKKGRPRMAGPSEFSVGPRVTDPSLEATLRPADQKNDRFTSERPSPSRRTPRALARFLIAALIGVAATLAWQHLGRPHSPPATNPSLGSEIAAESPPAAAASVPDASVSLAQTAQDSIAPPSPATPSLDLQQLETMARDLAAVRQSVEQLTAGQEQMARDLAKLEAARQEISRKIAAPAPRPAAAPAHKPVPTSPPAQPSPETSAELLKRVLEPFQVGR